MNGIRLTLAVALLAVAPPPLGSIGMASPTGTISPPSLTDLTRCAGEQEPGSLKTTVCSERRPNGTARAEASEHRRA